MTVVLDRVRSKAKANRPSIREVRLVGVVAAHPNDHPDAAWAAGGRVTWSGRTYRVEATQARMTGPGEPLRYVHLSALTGG